ncbi:MAG: tyrosine-type recombinase/integrase [Nitrosopumilus sp.]|nr:tyrosine-type recombinase/integrase [Nitrosopumilus sp.]MDH3517021.1 tyrosine-type recombinase/integrase [Nitrosopumilus sp.]MDH3565626.1 tyrosine-type recombinase/integrase [Nitrosopumilus sp.]MDH5417355.1 tyrosine-type recombinase/integrase [Nitrosopumilus sp.]MDH5555178.1 tyrosine-type recombinase/integrase [Nitrosopumilus sp.]
MEKRVKLPKMISEDPEPFRPEEVRILLDNASPKKGFLYMVLKDSGMRIGETLQIRKKDVDCTKNPVEIKIPAWATKTKKGRTAYITRETAQ